MTTSQSKIPVTGSLRPFFVLSVYLSEYAIGEFHTNLVHLRFTIRPEGTRFTIAAFRTLMRSI